MNSSKVKLKDLCYLSEFNLMKIIFSSGDYFPGFYRYTLGTQVVGDESLNLHTLIWLYLSQQMTHSFFSKEDWLELQHEIYDREIASEKARNAGNAPHVRDILNEKMMNWYFNCEGFDLIYIDIESRISELEENKTYYFMGSLISFSDKEVKINENKFSKHTSLNLNVSKDEAFEYIDSTFTKKQKQDLFLEAEIVGQLIFSKDNQGIVKMDEEKLDYYLLKNSNGKLLGVPICSKNLPIRFAKTIRLTNFRRDENGTFAPWRTNQNW